MQKFKGKVIKGKKRGKALGFPTANIVIGGDAEEGIYISRIYLKKIDYPSLTFIGAAITFGDKKVQAESYILDFNEDIYGKEVEVELLKKIRNNQKFATVEELIKAMEEDERLTREYFNSHPELTLSSRT